MANWCWRLDEEFALEGDWWPAGNKKEKCSGELRYSPGNGITLKRHRGYSGSNDEVEKWKMWLGLKPQVFTIHGIAGGGDPVTLKDCFHSSEGIVANAALIGVECDPGDPPKVESLVVKTSNLEAWIGGYVPKLQQKNGRLFAEAGPIQLEELRSGKLKSVGGTIKVYHGATHERRETSLQLGYQAELRILLDSPIPFADAQSISARILKLMSVLIGMPTVQTVEWFVFEGNGEASLIAPRTSRLNPRCAEKNEIRCPIDQQGFDFVSVLDGWLKVSAQFDSTVNLLYAVLMKTATFLEVEISEMMQALEAYCAGSDTYEYLPLEQFAIAENAMKESIADQTPEFKHRVAHAIKHFNRPSLRTYLSRLFQRLDPKLAGNVLGTESPNAFIGRAVDARNLITHPQSGNLWITLNQDEALDLISKLKLLLIVNLLKDAGMPLSILQFRYCEHRDWQWG